MKKILPLAILTVMLLHTNAQQIMSKLASTPVKYSEEAFGQTKALSGITVYTTKSGTTITGDKFLKELRTFTPKAKNATFPLREKLSAINQIASEKNSAADLDYDSDGDKKNYTSSLKATRQEKINFKRALYEAWELKRRWRFFPARNEAFARAFYGTNPDHIIDPLRNNYLAINNKTVGIYSEFFNGFAGPLRYSLGGFFSRTDLPSIDSADFKTVVDSAGIPYYAVTDVQELKDSISEIGNRLATLQNLLAGGGNAMFILSTPLLDANDRHDIAHLTVYASNKAALNIPQLSSGIKKVMFLDEISADLYFSFNMSNFTVDDKYQNAISFYIHGRAAGIIGTQGFMSSLGVSNKNAIAQFTVEGGFSILQNLRLFGKYTYTTDIQTDSSIPAWNAGFIITPTSLK